MTAFGSITISPDQVRALRRLAAEMQGLADQRSRAVEACPMHIALVHRLESETLTAAYGLLGYVQGCIGR